MSRHKHHDSLPPVIVDNGSQMLKSGFAGEDVPRSVIPTVLGRIRKDFRLAMCGIGEKEIYIGDEAQSMRGMLTLNYPIKRGYITNWDDMERIWHFMFFCELRIDPREHPVMLTDSPLNPNANREKMTQLMFETFQIPGFHVSSQAVLSLYGSGKSTGLVVDVGDTVSHVVPVYEGFALPHAIERSDIAGRLITERLQHLLWEQGGNAILRTTSELEMVRDMKEKLCFVSKNYASALEQFDAVSRQKRRSYVLPDEREIILGTEMFRAPELLFRPDLAGYQDRPLHEMVHRSIMKCDIDIRRQLYENILLSGGTTMFPGLLERLTSEMSALTAQVKITAPVERKYTCWIGGSILASLNSFHSQWITKEEYDETGPQIVLQKCF